MTKFCKDCKHIRIASRNTFECCHPSSVQNYDSFLVDGAQYLTDCYWMRHASKLCGEEGKLFERKLSQWEKVKLFWFSKEEQE